MINNSVMQLMCVTTSYNEFFNTVFEDELFTIIEQFNKHFVTKSLSLCLVYFCSRSSILELQLYKFLKFYYLILFLLMCIITK